MTDRAQALRQAAGSIFDDTRPPVDPGASVAPVTPPPARRRPRAVVKLDTDVATDARAAVRFLRGHGEPDLQLGELLDRLVTAGLERIRQEQNDGQPFPTTGDPLPRGGQLQ